jgi:hypothetical protein
MKNIKKRVINKMGDVLSYPTRTLQDALAANSNAAADAALLRKQKKQALIKSVIKRGRY